MVVANVEGVYEFTGRISNDKLNDFIALYTQNLAENHQKVEQLIVQGDLKHVRQIVHSTKSNALYVAAKQLSDSCLLLEGVIDTNAQISVIQQQWEMVSKEFILVIKYLEGYLADGKK